jgi:phosphosulfolactate phosphohydrolase-like enzyme
LAHLGIEDDVKFCLEYNKTSIIPILIKDELVILK